jgi:signal transduction histidine kinase/ligand-binding sensor domain-containing protein
VTPSREAPRALLSAVVALAAAFPCGRAFGLEPSRAMSQYVRDHWGSDRGFPGGAVHAIAQAADGYLWIGTERGLVRFDGLEFVLEEGSRGEGAPLGQVLGLAAGPRGELWVRLRGAHLLVRRDGGFEDAVATLGAEDAFTSMSAARDGGILLAGFVSGLVRGSGEGFETLAPGVALRTPVTALAEADDGRVWLGTRDAGLFYVERGKVTSAGSGLPEPKVNCVLPLDGGEVWVGTDRGVVRREGSALTSTGVAAPLRSVAAHVLVRDRGGSVWVGAGDGLWRVNQSGAVRLAPHGEAAAVTALFEDRDGNLWAGSEGRIERLQDSRFATWARAEGLPSESNGPVHVDGGGRTWFAPTSGGLYWLQSHRVERVRAAGLDSDVVYSIAGAGDGVWLGRRRGGLTHLKLRDGRIESRSFTRADGLAQDSVYAVHESRDGSVWAGTLSGGASRLRDARIATYTTADGLAADSVASIADDAEGTTWFATPGGLSALSHQGWRTYTTRDGLPADEVNCLLVGSSGELWIGTGDGLAVRTAAGIRPVRLGPVDRHEQVLGLAEDAAGSLWLATSRRILRVSKADLASAPGAPEEAVPVTEFGRADGLRGVEGVRRHRSVAAGAGGRIWFSTSGGLSAIDPSRLRSAEPVAVRVVGAAADGAALGLAEVAGVAEAVRVPPGPQRLTLHFEGVSLSAPEGLRFRYRLDGFDRDWSEPVSAREADYTNLAPGTYDFRVRAHGVGQGWIGPEAAVRLAVEPAFWHREWVRAVGLVLGAAGLFALYRYRVHSVTRRIRQRFDERLAERLRIAQDLHDTFLQGLASASMQLHVVTGQLPAEGAARPLLERVQELMRQVLEEGRDAVRELRSAGPDPGELAAALARVPAEVGAGERPEVRVASEGAPRPLRPLVRDEVHRVGREALANALRHSGATRVEVVVEYAPRGLRVLVRDDGAGIDAQLLKAGKDGHFGLSGMRERAERVGGRLTLKSAAGAGTEVELWVKGALCYAPRPASGPFAWVRRLGVPRGPGAAWAGIALACALSGCAARDAGDGTPVVITRIPPADEGRPFRLGIIEGRAPGARPGQQIVLYARSGAWWVQPLVDTPFTGIAEDSRWTNSTHLGTEYAALLVEPGYAPPATLDALPGAGDGVVAVATVRGRRFWSSPWFALALLSVAGVGALAFYGARMRRVTRELEMRFQERLAERTRLGQELHDTLLQGFVSASLQLHVAHDKLPASSPAKPALGRALELVGEVIEEGHRTVRALRSSARDPRDLEQALARLGSELPESAAGSLRVVVTGTARALRPILRDEVYRIGREAVLNAGRHAAATGIEAELEYTEGGLRLAVRDDGRGIDAPRLEQAPGEGSRGLRLMRDRAEAVGAQLQLRSRPGAGTEVVLFVPARAAFEVPPDAGRGSPLSWLRGTAAPPELDGERGGPR